LTEMSRGVCVFMVEDGGSHMTPDMRAAPVLMTAVSRVCLQRKPPTNAPTNGCRALVAAGDEYSR